MTKTDRSTGYGRLEASALLYLTPLQMTIDLQPNRRFKDAFYPNVFHK